MFRFDDIPESIPKEIFEIEILHKFLPEVHQEIFKNNYNLDEKINMYFLKKDIDKKIKEEIYLKLRSINYLTKYDDLMNLCNKLEEIKKKYKEKISNKDKLEFLKKQNNIWQEENQLDRALRIDADLEDNDRAYFEEVKIFVEHISNEITTIKQDSNELEKISIDIEKEKLLNIIKQLVENSPQYIKMKGSNFEEYINTHFFDKEEKPIFPEPVKNPDRKEKINWVGEFKSLTLFLFLTNEKYHIFQINNKKLFEFADDNFIFSGKKDTFHKDLSNIRKAVRYLEPELEKSEFNDLLKKIRKLSNKEIIRDNYQELKNGEGEITYYLKPELENKIIIKIYNLLNQADKENMFHSENYKSKDIDIKIKEILESQLPNIPL